MINPAHFDLQSLRVFQLVAQCGGLTQAANKSHMTLSALSKRIADLERTVGCALFLRVRRGLELTPAGHELVQHARMVLDKVNQMAGEMSDFATGVRGHVKVWANTSAVIQFLPHDLASFLASQPMIRISLEERLSQDVVVALLSGETDIGVFADNVPAYDVRKSVYRRDRLVVLVPAGHALAGRPEVSFDETLEYDFVGLNQGSSLLQRLTDAASALDKVVRLRIQVSSFDAICRMIEAGLGIGVLPDGAVRPELLGAGLHAVYLSDAWASRILWLGVRDEAGLLPEARTLLEHLRATGSASASR